MTHDEILAAAEKVKYLQGARRRLAVHSATDLTAEARYGPVDSLCELMRTSPEAITMADAVGIQGLMAIRMKERIDKLEAELAPPRIDVVATLGREWLSGPPPHVGWWNASTDRSKSIWRWWDGAKWSPSCPDVADAEYAADVAAAKNPDFLPVLWTTYWPENARVPRVAP